MRGAQENCRGPGAGQPRRGPPKPTPVAAPKDALGFKIVYIGCTAADQAAPRGAPPRFERWLGRFSGPYEPVAWEPSDDRCDDCRGRGCLNCNLEAPDYPDSRESSDGDRCDCGGGGCASCCGYNTPSDDEPQDRPGPPRKG